MRYVNYEMHLQVNGLLKSGLLKSGLLKRGLLFQITTHVSQNCQSGDYGRALENRNA